MVCPRNGLASGSLDRATKIELGLGSGYFVLGLTLGGDNLDFQFLSILELAEVCDVDCGQFFRRGTGQLIIGV